MVLFNETFGGAQHQVSISSTAEAGGARHYILTTRCQNGCAGHSHDMYLRLVVWVETGNLFAKKGYLSAAVVQVGTCLPQERVPQDNLGAHSCVGYDEVHMCYPAPSVHW